VIRLAVTLVAAAALAGLASAATVTGTPLSDRLVGTKRADVMDGRGGNDRLLGLAGADLLQGGAGRDRVDAGAGDDRIPAHADGKRDVISCGRGRDVVTAERIDSISRDCEIVSRQISVDGTTDPIGQHATEVEPDTFAFASTVVSVFQVGRVSEGGAVAIGFATSKDAGATWKSGLLPGLTDSSPQAGVDERASDPTIAYDAQHGVWMAVTLGISPATNAFHLYASRSADGLSWSAPVAAVTAPAGQLDKEWVACDNGAASPFRGRCYVSYLHVPSGELMTTFTNDGGATWSTPVATATPTGQGVELNGVQPLALPNGTLVVIYTAFVDPRAGQSRIEAVRSTDGGLTFGAPVTAARFGTVGIEALRTFSLASAEMDGSGRMYVAWEGCRGTGSCTSKRILFTSSADGVSWTSVATVSSGAPSVSNFLPGLGATGQGRLALVYHSVRTDCAEEPNCPGIDVFERLSTNGGRTWTRPQRLTADSMKLDWIARTRLGLMLADYVSISFARGRPVSVFVIAAPRVGAAFRQAAFARVG
jgi:hypothetical protein